jgi:hypothetical protein
MSVVRRKGTVENETGGPGCTDWGRADFGVHGESIVSRTFGPIFTFIRLYLGLEEAGDDIIVTSMDDGLEKA